jgi:hypothetical protein
MLSPFAVILSPSPVILSEAKNLRSSLSRKSPEACHSERSEESPQFALSKITRGLSFPRKRESSSMWTYVDPRLRGGDNTGDFHLFGWAAGPWTLRVDSAKHLSSSSPPAELKKNCRDPSPAQKQGELRMTYDINLRIQNESRSGKA